MFSGIVSESASDVVVRAGRGIAVAVTYGRAPPSTSWHRPSISHDYNPRDRFLPLSHALKVSNVVWDRVDGDGKLNPVRRTSTISAPPFLPQGAQTTARSFTRPSMFQLQNTSTSLATNYRVNFINEFPALFPPTSLRNPYSVVPPNPFPLPCHHH